MIILLQIIEIFVKAWLKFYVTDKQLTKSFQDPDWFEEDEYEFKMTPTGHYIIATSPFIHEPSIELVNGYI